MVKQLRKRPRADTQANDIRKRGLAWGRNIYLLMLLALGLGLANYLWGDRVVLRADGIVLQDGTEVAATSIVSVDEVLVRPGDEVAPGDLLLRVGSAQILSDLAQHSARAADLAQRETELRARLLLADEVLALAETRAADSAGDPPTATEASVDGVDDVLNSVEAQGDGRLNAERLRAERDALSSEMETLSTARADAEGALADLRTHYSGGEIRTLTGGTVGTSVPLPGAVFVAGSPIMRVLSGESYVVAFLPRRYMFGIEPGLPVTVVNGQASTTGTVAEVLAISQSLPEELRTAFKPGDRHRLARIRLDTPDAFPTYANVRIRSQPASDPILGPIFAIAQERCEVEILAFTCL